MATEMAARAVTRSADLPRRWDDFSFARLVFVQVRQAQIQLHCDDLPAEFAATAIHAVEFPFARRVIKQQHLSTHAFQELVPVGHAAPFAKAARLTSSFSLMIARTSTRGRIRIAASIASVVGARKNPM